MGNGCSSLFSKKICFEDVTNIVISIKEEKEEKKDTKDTKDTNKIYLSEFNNNNLVSIINKNKNTTIIRNDNDLNNINISSLSANNSKNYMFNKNILKIENEIKPNKEAKISLEGNLQSENLISFTNMVKELDMSFVLNKSSEQFQIFDMNYISVKKNYNEKMLEIINQIRNKPKSIIEDYDLMLNKNNKENLIFIENDETHENVVFNDITQDINETVNFLKNVKPVMNKFNLNEELVVDTKFNKNSELSFEKKITKIITNQKKEIIRKYPKVQFFVKFIKDEKICILFLLMKNAKISNFRNVIFDDEYKEFNVTWMKDKNNIFISFLCFS
jgi:hypothetical protein